MAYMEKACVASPLDFWNYVGNLGPSKKRDIPWEININGEISIDKNVILAKWKSDFENLYQFESKDFNDVFKDEKLSELNKVWDAPELTLDINAPIMYEEVKCAVESTKVRKAVGLDNIPNELLKNENVMKLLHSLFYTCFKTGLIPSTWKTALIHPIPKSSKREIDPLKYRGLALQLCIFKVYCAILNKRIVGYLEDNNILEEEQNGFR